MRIEFLAGELVTGDRLTQLPVTAGSWSVVLNEAGEIGVTIPLSNPKIANRDELLAQLEPWRCFLAVVADGQVLEAGPIVGHPSFDYVSGALQVKALGLWSIFERRALIPIGGNPVLGSVSPSNMSLRTIAKRIVQNALNQPGGSLPVGLEPDFPGDNERSYPGYEFAAAAERLSEVVEVERGPDVEFRPEFTPDMLGIRWQMVTGDPLLKQEGADHIWDSSAPKSGVSGVSVSSDASTRANRVFATGDGMETTLRMGSAEDSSQWARGYPLLDSVISHSSAKRITTLERHARAALQAGRKPWTTWTMTVKADIAPRLGSYRPGDWVRVIVPADHVYLRGGEYRARIGRISGDAAGQDVTVDLLPRLENR